MNWDQTSAYVEGSGQQDGVSHNHDNNCVPLTYSKALQALGYPFIKAQALTDATYGPGYLGGERFIDVANTVNAQIDRNLRISVESADVFSIMDQYGPLGFPLVFLGHSDGWGNYKTVDMGIQHASIVLRRTNNYTVLMNSERGQEVGYDDSDLGSIYDRGMVVFHRSVWRSRAMTTDEHNDLCHALVRIVYLSVLHREPESVEAHNVWANYMFAHGFDATVTAMIDGQAEATSNITQDYNRNHSA